ncbi:MAG: glycoside hydrolase family 2 TIM barrel-domain containing protein [Lacibacter sp.]
MKRIAVSIAVFLFLLQFSVHAQKGRTVTDLSNNNWKLMIDPSATWVQDILYAPPVDIKKLPVHQPSGGWNSLQKEKGINVHLPATVEQYYWGKNGSTSGVTGNYLGVSWFVTTVNIPSSFKGKRISLQFDAVRFRAEIFVNEKLVGYDLVNSTPFEIDITHAVRYGTTNQLAVRITDPNGNFDWRDSQNFMWGNYRTNPTHGFGGITGKVKLVTTDKIYCSDVFVKNKPMMNEVDLEVSLSNTTAQTATGHLQLQVNEAKPGGKTVFTKNYFISEVKPGTTVNTFTVTVADAKLWSVDSPNLYKLTAIWKGNDESSDLYQQRFGFRWFEVRNVQGDQQFYLNGKRIVLLTSISWGFWPDNGIAPSDALAKKQIEAAKKIGLNMLNFHRTIGQQNVLDYADELGLLYFEEPGGNQYPANMFNPADSLGKVQADFYFAFRNEKLFRMIRRDRNHPSLVIYNMHNERGAEPQQQDKDQMLAAHHLDETRILTYNSSNGAIKQGPDPRFKLHLFPYDFNFYDYGWFDQHHAGGPGVYHDNLYRNPKDYLRYTDKKDEIIYYGEEGAIGTPPRLELIRNEILKTGRTTGWEADDYLKWYDAYQHFLQTHPSFHQAFPSVDSLTRSMGNVAYYYQGRAIENVRINNTIDGYAVNGWESMKLENHSGVVDNYRNLKGDAELIARYTRPLYVAVKLNRKVVAAGDTSVADFFIVNTVNLNGSFDLKVTVVNAQKQIILSKTIPVTISGGVVYGELLSAGLQVPVLTAGYTTVQAELVKAGKTITKGDDKIFAVAHDALAIPAEGMIADTSGVLKSFFISEALPYKEYKSGRPEGKFLVVGAFQPQQTGNQLVTDILEWVNEGNTLIIIKNTDAWAAHLAQKEVFDYRGTKELRTTWYGGNFFSREHALLKGLPQASVFNWEYQCFVTYNKSRSGLRLYNGETVVACVADHAKEVFSALSIVPHGRGKIIICTLDIFSCLAEEKQKERGEGDGENAAMNTINASSRNSANIVGRQLLLNMLKFSASAEQK